jgi:hypothetical protein
MTRAEVESAVCRATGENRRLVRSYGFSLVEEEPQLISSPSLTIDCPGCGASLEASNISTGSLKFIECPRCDAVYPFAIDEIYVLEGSTTAQPACA